MAGSQHKIFRVLARTMMVFVLLLLVLFGIIWTILKVPAVQNFLVQKAMAYVSNKTHTRVELKHIDIEFPQSVVLDGVFIEDKRQDTLLWVSKLKIGIHLSDLLTHKISIQQLYLENSYGQLIRTASDSSYNFQFLVDAFSSSDTSTTIKPRNSTPWEVAADHVQLINCRFNMADEMEGLYVNACIGKATVQLRDLDLDKKKLDLRDVLIRDTHAEVLITQNSSKDTSSRGRGWDIIQASNVTLDNVACRYEDRTACQQFQTKVGNLQMRQTNISLAKQRIRNESLELINCQAFLQMEKDTLIVYSDKHHVAQDTSDWNIESNGVQVKGCFFKMDFTNRPSIAHGVDWNHLYLKNIETDVPHFLYHGDDLAVEVKQLKIQERSGLGVKNLQTVFRMDPNQMEVKKLNLQTNHSKIGSYAWLKYKNLEQLTNDFQLRCNLSDNQLGIEDLLLLQPQWRAIEFMQTNAGQNLLFSLNTEGNNHQLVLNKCNLSIGSYTGIQLSGKIKEPVDLQNMKVEFANLFIRSTRKDIHQLIPDSLLPQAITLPDTLTLEGFCNASLNNVETQLQVNSTFGEADLKGEVTQMREERPQYKMDLKTQHFDLGSLLQRNTLGAISFTTHLEGSGKKMEDLHTAINGNINSVRLNQYTYRSIQLNGRLDTGYVDAQIAIQDSNLHAEAKGNINLNHSRESCNIQLQLKGMDLKAMNLTSDEVLISAKGEVVFKGNSASTLNGHMAIRNILLVKDHKEYTIDSLVFANLNEKGNTEATLNSSLVAASFKGNMDLLSVMPSVERQVNRYFHLFDRKETAKSTPQHFQFELQLNDDPVLREVLLPKLASYANVHVVGGFNSDSARLWTRLELPELEYDKFTLQNFKCELDSDPERMTYTIGWEILKSGDIAIEQTAWRGLLAKDTLTLDWHIDGEHQKDKLMLKARLANAVKDRFRFFIDEGGLVLRGNQWKVDRSNYIEFGPHYLFVDRLNLSSGDQFIKVQSDSTHLSVAFHRFELHELSQVVEQEDTLLKGIMNGNIRIKDLFNKAAFTSDLNVTDLVYRQSPIGNVSIQANNLTEDRYTMQMRLTGRGNRVSVSGYYAAKEENTLRFKLAIDSLQLASVEPFSFGQMKESKGKVKGSLQLTGSLKDPQINGTLRFIQAGTRITFLNEYMTMDNEILSMKKEKVYFQKFKLKDSQGNVAELNGTVNIGSITQPSFDLNLTTNDFMVLNTTEVNNKLYYGRILLDSKIDIKGTSDLPIVKANVKIEKGSHFSFAIPESQVSTDKGEGIVVFVKDSSYFDKIMLREQDIAGANTIKGISLTAKITVDPRTSFTLLVDPYSGDSLQVSGEADLLFALNPDGNMELSGRYIIEQGSYKATLEGLVPKEFAIVKGSKIEWYGDPLDATVDVTARYDTRTKPSGLMSIGAALTPSESAAYAQPLKFYIYMMMTGELLHPQISFRLDMPEDEKGAGGGAVYGKLNTINSDEAELNKQVFSLLVFNSFMASSNGSNGGTASDFARSSVSRLMSDQLNKLSSQYIKGVEVDVDVVSYNQNDAATNQKQGNTQLQVGVKKTLFDERLSVQVGGNVMLEGQQSTTDPSTTGNSQNITGDVVVEYKITKNGRYKLKGFRVNQLDGVTNGIITQTGVGFVYTRDYNRTRDLFKRRKKAKTSGEGSDTKTAEEED